MQAGKEVNSRPDFSSQLLTKLSYLIFTQHAKMLPKIMVLFLIVRIFNLGRCLAETMVVFRLVHISLGFVFVLHPF